MSPHTRSVVNYMFVFLGLSCLLAGMFLGEHDVRIACGSALGGIVGMFIRNTGGPPPKAIPKEIEVGGRELKIPQPPAGLLAFIFVMATIFTLTGTAFGK